MRRATCAGGIDFLKLTFARSCPCPRTTLPLSRGQPDTPCPAMTRDSEGVPPSPSGCAMFTRHNTHIKERIWDPTFDEGQRRGSAFTIGARHVHAAQAACPDQKCGTLPVTRDSDGVPPSPSGRATFTRHSTFSINVNKSDKTTTCDEGQRRGAATAVGARHVYAAQAAAAECQHERPAARVRRHADGAVLKLQDGHLVRQLLAVHCGCHHPAATTLAVRAPAGRIAAHAAQLHIMERSC